MQIINLHIGLIKYLYTELKKKRTPKELLIFLAKVGKSYLKELLKLYKQLFDPEYQKQKKEYEKQKKIKADLQRAIRLLKYIDDQMIKTGMSRQERRGYWKNFYTNGQIRTDVFNNLSKEVGD